MARVPIKIPPENSLRAIFFPGPPACSAFPTTHTLHPSHQYAPREIWRTRDPPFRHPSPRHRRPSRSQPSRLSLSKYLLPSLSLFFLSFYQTLFCSLSLPPPLSLFLSLLLSLCRVSFLPRAALVFVFIISRQIAFLILFPLFRDLIVMYTHACVTHLRAASRWCIVCAVRCIRPGAKCLCVSRAWLFRRICNLETRTLSVLPLSLSIFSPLFFARRPSHVPLFFGRNAVDCVSWFLSFFEISSRSPIRVLADWLCKTP